MFGVIVLSLVISKREIERRRLLSKRMRAQGIDALYLASSANVAYVTNFFIPTERPVAAILLEGGETVMFVPRLEVEHVERYAYVDRVEYYLEYPDERRPMYVFLDLMRRPRLEGRTVGFDFTSST